MDIHSILSPILFVSSIIIIYLRARQDEEESVNEVGFALVGGSIILLVCTIVISVMYYIIFNERLFSQYDPTPRETIVFIQYYYTLLYYITIILNKYVLKD